MSIYHTYSNFPHSGNQMYLLNPPAYHESFYPINYGAHSSPRFLGFDFGSKHLWQGLVIGAGLTIILSNDYVQRFILKALAQSWTGIVSGIEEMKEKFEDVRQEINLKKEQERG